MCLCPLELPTFCLPILSAYPILFRSVPEQEELRADPGVPLVTPLSRSVRTTYPTVLTRL